MRLQLRLTLGLSLLLAATTVRADVAPETSARVDVYSDEWITVISPSWLGTLRPTEELTVEARYSVDVLSGATQVLVADAITSATSFAEERHQVGAAVTAQPTPEWTIGAAATGSVEPDFSTYSVGVNGAVEILDRLATLSLAYDIRVDTAGLATDETFKEGTIGHALNLGWTHVLTKDTLLKVLVTGSVVTCGELIGCHSSPYRYVPVFDNDGAAPTMQVALRERHPDLLVQGAAAVRVSQYLGAGFALHGGYRFFRDNWAITGHTADLTVAKELWEDRLLIRLDGRFTQQDPASFYESRYTTDGAGLPKYRSADREMAGLIHGMAGGRVDLKLPNLGPLRQLRLTARVARLWYQYPSFDALPERNAWLIGGGIGAKL